ncbi:MAG: AMP-binding protein [Gammaproteobacteria bacterium]|nr:AMP-binding protein [Gammaproteobacteria bacterium]
MADFIALLWISAEQERFSDTLIDYPAFPIILAATFVVILILTYVAWRRYLRMAEKVPHEQEDNCQYSLTDLFSDRHLINVPHQKGVRWLTEIFSRSARQFPDLTALQIPHTGESLTFAQLNARAENIAAALSPFLTGPDQVVAVAMSQDNWQIVASHLGILKAGGTAMFLDTTLPDALVAHMLDDSQPVVVVTRGEDSFYDLPTLNILALPDNIPPGDPPPWLDDPSQRLATIFYTSGTTGMPKGVECPHAGYVNLALSYADYFDLAPGMDATSLTSSLGYDGSISEMYSAWVSGCAVVMLTKEQVRSGPDLVPVLHQAEVTVLFCPPVLLTTLTPNPELDLPYPLCRYIIPAGEAFPSALVEPWTRGRRQIINTYGPTEASTDTSRQSLRQGEPVTIGSPFANVTYVILEADQLRPLPHGEVGELCIGGVHVARGYRNLPEQTALKFITHPQFGRLYRTGDKCRIDIETQRVHFLGRIDAQLKVRGHRVETQAVEDMLQAQFGEIEASVLDYQNEELVAFISAPSISKEDIRIVARAPTDWAAQTTEILARQLPPPAVPSRFFLVESFIMKPVSGKIDRECLPDLSMLLNSTMPDAQGTTGNPHTGSYSEDAEKVSSSGTVSRIEPGCEEVLEICQAVFEAPLGWDDVFTDNGGHSIVIAQLAQRLHAAGWVTPVRALLGDCNTARKIATRLRKTRKTANRPTTASREPPHNTEQDEAAARVLSLGYFTGLQILFLVLLYSPHLIGFLGLVAFAEIGEFFMTAGLGEFIGVGFLAYLLALIFPFASLLWVMVIKLLMGGHPYKNNITPGVYPQWSRMHLRVWCIGRLEKSVIAPLGAMFRSAPLMAYTLRRLGATVGNNLQCASDVELSGPLDLLSIGDNVAIQTGAYIHTSRWLGRKLHLGPVRLENGCKIGMRAAIAGHVTVGQGSRINPFTPIIGDVGPEEMWEGAPARFSGRCTQLKRTANTFKSASPFWCSETLNILMQIFLEFWLVVVPTAAVTWFAATFIPVTETAVPSEYFKVTPLPEIIWHMGLYAFITTWVTIVLISVLVCLFLRCTAARPGLYSTHGLTGYLLLYRMKKMNQVQRQWTWTITGQYLRALAGMHFPRLGASECDLMFNLVPELASADSQVFWSNGCFTNMLDYGAEHIVLRQFDMPRNFFSGNNCVAEYGQFPSNFLLGVSTPGNEIQHRRQMHSRLGRPITVAGNPPVEFASTRFEQEDETQKLPGLSLFLARVFLNDIFSIGILRIQNLLTYVILYTSLLRLGGHIVVSAFIALILSETILVVLCAAIKKLLVGSKWGSAHSTPFWSWRHFTYFFAQDCFFAWCQRPLSITAGTVLPNIILRLMGGQIGKRTLIASPMQVSDWNAVNFGDDCIVNGFLQFHTFENMMLKVKLTHIQEGSTVGFGATVMGGAVIGPGTTLLPLSLVLKEMHLPTATYEGSPVESSGNDH